MKPVELFDKCMEAIDSFNRGEVYADEPFIMLVIPRKAPIKGDHIRLFGRSGPLGRVATGKPRDDGLWDMVAYFPAIGVLKALGAAFDVKVNVRRQPHAQANMRGTENEDHP